MSHLPLEFESSQATNEMPLGPRLRARREALGWSLQDVAERLRLKQQLIEQIEMDRFDVLGAPVYVRGYLTAYLKLLDMPLVLVGHVAAFNSSPDAQIPPTLPAAVVRRSNIGLLRVVRRTGHVLLTAAIVVPVIWLASYGRLPSRKAEITPLEVPVVSTVAIPERDPVLTSPLPVSPASNTGATRAESYPVMASLAPGLSVTPPAIDVQPATELAAAPVESGLVLDVSQDSWVELRDATGQVVDMGVFRAGTTHRYDVSAGYRLALGNADGVEVRLNGAPLDVSPYQRANVARITLGKDGVAAPTGG